MAAGCITVGVQVACSIGLLLIDLSRTPEFLPSTMCCSSGSWVFSVNSIPYSLSMRDGHAAADTNVRVPAHTVLVPSAHRYTMFFSWQLWWRSSDLKHCRVSSISFSRDPNSDTYVANDEFTILENEKTDKIWSLWLLEWQGTLCITQKNQSISTPVQKKKKTLPLICACWEIFHHRHYNKCMK